MDSLVSEALHLVLSTKKNYAVTITHTNHIRNQLNLISTCVCDGRP
jgi:hypothetical protein